MTKRGMKMTRIKDGEWSVGGRFTLTRKIERTDHYAYLVTDTMTGRHTTANTVGRAIEWIRAQLDAETGKASFATEDWLEEE
jgi:hypothetical protein